MNMLTDEPLIDCREYAHMRLGHADLHRPLAIRCSGRVYPPADVIIWTWNDVIINSYDVVDDVRVNDKITN